MNKSDLRSEAKQKLQYISFQERDDIEKTLQNVFFKSEIWRESDTVGVTISQGFEWDTISIIQEGWGQNKQVVVPKCNPQTKEMQFYKLSSFDDLETVYYGLKEPDPMKTEAIDKDKIDLLIVPGLLFNQDGYRIGFGGGYYDRFLSNFQGKTLMMASEHQRNSTIPVERFDQPVAYVLTERGMHSTGSTN
ncbi:5-formyltetrahydrofolate cyclo-ligase [Halobacillus locisalis]|uniref:5-formyltetrahydrofolate cyclo-ligase n=1 Tax=Halobacillus locisalis TaxID=220753 RepID=A0A838CNW8_9BACI|nr:5-formyltetrahydrofolate cyclo-ligase [Halobacillus locisalis]MBA2173593.1 5-formyltetrahydrofolate cyclo-ligase [Halobacillus locisalis]